MIHNREADQALLQVLREEGAPETVIFHCFSSGADLARECVDAGYVLSFSGTVSFKNAKALREAAPLVPSDQLIVETDAPFLTPHPFRGARTSRTACRTRSGRSPRSVARIRTTWRRRPPRPPSACTASGP